jgi:hypothetical protein
MRTPLPEKLGDKPAKDDESGLVYEVMNNQDKIITYLAELTKVVEGKQDKFTLKESMFGENSTACAGTPGTFGADTMSAIHPHFTGYTDQPITPGVITDTKQTPTLKETLYKEGYKQALKDVRAGVPEHMQIIHGHVHGTSYTAGHNDCSTTILEHLDLLGKE